MRGASSAQEVGDRCDCVGLCCCYRASADERGGAGGGEGGCLESLVAEDALVYDVVALAEELGLVRGIWEQRWL